MSVTLSVCHTGNLRDLCLINPHYEQLCKLFTFPIINILGLHCNLQRHHLPLLHLGHIYIHPIIVIGKSGYGKSSLLNSLIGMDIFPTDPVCACTEKIDTALFSTDQLYHYFAFCDLPGIAEKAEIDTKYLKWYQTMVPPSSCIIYVLRADMRDYSKDQEVFDLLFSDPNTKRKVIIALNCADKIEPVNRSTTLTPEQIDALISKVDTVSKQFAIPKHRIIPCSASTDYGLNSLLEQVLAVYGSNRHLKSVHWNSNQTLSLN